jgi:hypothetical protein
MARALSRGTKGQSIMGQNPILAKKQGSKFYTPNFSTPRALSSRQNPFSQEKNSSNKADTRLSPKRGNDQRNGCAVTTSHLLLQDLPGETVALLPIWQPNSEFLGAKSNARAKGGPGGIRPCETGESARSESSHGILFQMDASRGGGGGPILAVKGEKSAQSLPTSALIK